jgi:hypothetical protein
MTQQLAAKKPVPVSPPPGLPDERFWVRYSEHHELPLSSVGSIAIHVLVVALAFALWYVGWNLWKDDKSLPVEAVALAGGGGGNPQGIGNDPGVPNAGAPEAVEQKPNEPQRPPDAPQPDKLKPVQPAPPQFPEIKDPDIRRLIDAGNEAVASIGQLNQKTRETLAKGLRSGKGEGGGGSGGGTGRGQGTGKGDGVGPGQGTVTVSQREKRVMRWDLEFNPLKGRYSGEDYVRDLQTLGAILAIQDPKHPDGYLVIRDLTKRPARPQPEDLSEIKRIFFVDRRPDSVGALATALQLRPMPDHIIAFFPEELEEKLLKLELAHAKGRSEDDIQSTRFHMLRVGNRIEPRVVAQKYLR